MRELTRIIHEAPTATAYLLDLANDFRVCLFDVLGSQPPVPNAEIVHHFGHLHSLATTLHESSRLITAVPWLWCARLFRGGSSPEEFEETGNALAPVLSAVLEGESERALRLLTELAQRDAAAVLPYLLLGRMYRTRGDVARAVKIHQSLLVRGDLDSETRLRALAELAADYEKAGFLQRAIAAYEEVLRCRSNHLQALRALAGLHAQARNFPRALQLAQRLRRTGGDRERRCEISVLLHWAEAARSEGRDGEARKALKQTLRADPRLVRAWLLLGDLEAERGHKRAALRAWRQVVECDPRTGREVYPRLAATFAALGRGRDFEIYLLRRLTAQPADVSARLALARSLAARGEFAGARAELGRVFERDLDNLEAHRAFGQLLLDQRDAAAMAKAYAELLEALDRQRPETASWESLQ